MSLQIRATTGGCVRAGCVSLSILTSAEHEFRTLTASGKALRIDPFNRDAKSLGRQLKIKPSDMSLP